MEYPDNIPNLLNGIQFTTLISEYVTLKRSLRIRNSNGSGDFISRYLETVHWFVLSGLTLLPGNLE